MAVAPSLVLERPRLQAQIAAALAPMVRAIGAGMGPDGRRTLYAEGRAVRPALTGAEAARKLCGADGAAGAVQAILREALVAADRELGDGTARLAVMCGAALDSALRAIAAGIPPEALRGALCAQRGALDAAFAAATLPLADPLAVASAAGAGPALAGPLVAALDQVGTDGRVELVTNPAPGIELRPSAGFVLDAPAVEADPLTALDAPSLIVADDIIRDFQTLVPVIEGFAQRRRPLIVATRGIEGAALALIERNRRAGVLTVTALTPADAGPRAARMLEDLAVATGAALVADRTGLTLGALRPAMLGRAGAFRRDGDRVFLTEPAGDPAAVALRLGEIAGDIAASRHLDLDREHAQRRHARLSGAWVEMAIAEADPATTERSLARARRALAALVDAYSGGVIAGGGAGLTQVARALPAAEGPAAEAALRMTRAALTSVGHRLARTAGLEDAGALLPGAATDPARLSRRLLDQALSLAVQLAGLDGAVVRR